MNRMKRRGFTLIEVVITVALIAILIAIAIPSLTGYRRGAERDGCKDQMRSILSAIEQVRLERDTEVLDAVEGSGTIDALVTGTSGGNYRNKYLPEAMTCPSGGSYTISHVEDSDTWIVTCPNAATKGHTL